MSRTRLIALVLTGVAAAVFASWFLTWLRATPVQIGTSDYAPAYVAGTAWRHGLTASLYDPRAQLAQGAALGLSGAQFAGNRFVDPPLAAAVVAPFTLLDLDASFRLWSLLQLGLVVVAVMVAAGAAPWPPATPRGVRVLGASASVAFAGTAMLVLLGQWDGFSALGLALGYAGMRRGRPAASGALLVGGLLLAKPHLALALLAWLLGRRDRRMLAGAAGAFAVIVVASLLAVGPAGVAAAVTAPALAAGVTPVRMLLGFLGLFASWFGGGPAAYALAATAGALALTAGFRLGAWTRRAPQTLELSLAAAIVLSLLAAPHMLVQDLAVLTVPLVWCLARAAAADGIESWPGPWTLTLLAGWVALDLAARADVGNYSPAPPGRLVPVVLIAVLAAGALAVSRQRRRMRVPTGGGRAPRAYVQHHSGDASA